MSRGGSVGSAGAKGGKKKGATTFTIDCAKPVEDKIMDIASSRTLGDSVTVSRDKNKITVTSEGPFSKRYLKYLTKKYLKKHNVRDWLRVIASNKDRSIYELRYFNIAENEGMRKTNLMPALRGISGILGFPEFCLRTCCTRALFSTLSYGIIKVDVLFSLVRLFMA
ncbi:unnamed protein product [Spirodela intermedia]|uniref:Large ribosomal subunit protein eL22 n=1 Tax=Spirodela intermedia TaxID=51605 RepID=A0A7I8IWG9_SPIIN|nr:unnamed protein product [Spirodela intermedia]CAA6662023.1 unnamed protein product [Spirodela intermedia]